jgi:hypothetical protein
MYIVEHVAQNSYLYLSFVSTLLLINNLIGIFYIDPNIIQLFNSIFVGLVSVLLIYYFNPLKGGQLTKFHRRIGFTAGILLMSTAGLRSIYYLYNILHD